LNVLRLVLAQQPVVHQHARELVPYRPVHEQRSHGRVDAARQPADHAAVADLGADPLDLLLDDRSWAPGRLAPADVREEVLEDVLAVRGVDDLRVELDSVEGALHVLEGCDRRSRRRGERREPRRRLEDRVAVRHPARLLARKAGQQPAGIVDRQLGPPELTDLRALDPAAESEREELHAVADAEHRDPELQQARVEPRRPRRVHGGWATREDQPARLALGDRGGADVVREQL
jgi:hypothetical protein